VPFTDKKTEITTRIPVAETVIIGDVPEFYIDRTAVSDNGRAKQIKSDENMASPDLCNFQVLCSSFANSF